ncbi:dynein regulatory complex protein 9-like isoform X3 [Pectinophora gossypiella]|uniref:dynein regulatory complex protein 9-like isoform X3 n=1 Tax=Pectinophora gossypiella TaxID=13191 RepID=UPI00214F2BAB|nr:dynein regulatory complex protein 9-like isoform X3 [Pectinophora gossypiella]
MPNAGVQSDRGTGDIEVLMPKNPDSLLRVIRLDEDSLKSQSLLTPVKVFSKCSKESSRSTMNEIEIHLEAIQYETDNYFRLHFFISSFFATILEDAITSLRILEELNSSMGIIKIMDEMPNRLKMKYGVELDTDKGRWLDHIDPKRLSCLEYKLHKLSRDRTDVHEVLLATYVNLAMSRSYRALWEWMEAVKLREQVMKDLVEEEAKNKITARDVRRQLRQQRNHQKSAVYATERVVDNLVRRIEDSELTASVEGRYVHRWQRARHEQHEETIRLKELSREETIDIYKVRLEQETRIHQEIELIININVHETLQQIELWMTKYDRDMEAMDLSITIMKNNYQKACDQRQALENQRARKSTVPRLLPVEPTADATATKEQHESEEDLDSDDIYWCLPFFQSSLMATILEDTITQLRILIECNSEMRVAKTIADLGYLRAIKYGVQQSSRKKDILDSIDVKNLHCVEYKLNKLEADRLRRELSKQLRQQRNHQKTVTYEAESIIGNLRSSIEDAVLLAETQGRYVDNWQNARTEQHKDVIHGKESFYSDSTEFYKMRTDHESRVHLEVENFTNILINETLKSIEDWMDKYEEDMEKIDLRIQIQKNDYQNMHDKRRGMEKLYNKHWKEMKDWNTFKEERAKAQLYHDTMQKSAIIVQAWWRGLLVRKQLGPFRPKKKKGGGKGK